MAEWWNLDQMVIWTHERSPDLVARAAGDAQGIRCREVYYFDLMPADDASDLDAPQQGIARSQVARFLASGRVITRDATDDAAPYPLDIVFDNYECAIANDGPHLALRSLTYPYRWLYILIEATSIRAVFPPKAPSAMQEELANFVGEMSASPMPSISPTRPARFYLGLTIKAWLDQHRPQGLPDASREQGKRREVCREIAQFLIEQHGVANPKLNTIERMARDWEDERGGKKD